jgi:dynein heavy chain 2
LQALALGFGGNPYGPAGTGKTESVKALGAALGRQVGRHTDNSLCLNSRPVCLAIHKPSAHNPGCFNRHCCTWALTLPRPSCHGSTLTPPKVLVFNCDGEFDLTSMGRIFTGLMLCGAWGCFDEFNRLGEDVLSAVSQQIQAIQVRGGGRCGWPLCALFMPQCACA